MKHSLTRLVKHLGLELADLPWATWERYRRWLATEATAAGGIGPDEGSRLAHRHIGDSLSYAATFLGPPRRLVDYGSGVGLPGIPLAVLWPDTQVVLWDRSRRRVELMDRAVRVLGLRNVTVEMGQVEDDHALHDAIVTRAVFPPSQWIETIAPRLSLGGRAVTATGNAEIADELLVHPGCVFRRQALPVEVLDHRVAFLIMSKTTLGAAE